MTPQMDSRLATAVAVDAGNASCRKAGRTPTALGPWPSEEWSDSDWETYHAQLVKCWRLIDPGIADAMARDWNRWRAAA